MHTLIRLSLHYLESLAIPRLLHLHIRARVGNEILQWRSGFELRGLDIR